MTRIDEKEGRYLFGSEAEAYDQIRPEYPGAIYSFLVDQKAIFPGAATLEIGAGNGLATRQLIELGSDPVTVVEPDERFVGLLDPLYSSCDLRIFQSAFEDTDLPSESFDLAVAATSFHWLDPDTRVDLLAKVLKVDGYAALFWNVFQDLNRRDEFHEATQSVLAHLANSPSNGAPDTLPFALDREAREAEFARSGRFEIAAHLEVCWTFQLTTSQVGLLYSSFSSIACLPDKKRTELLNKLMEIADNKFNGAVKRNMTSPLYLFKRV